jgi:hypothetical protein
MTRSENSGSSKNDDLKKTVLLSTLNGIEEVTMEDDEDLCPRANGGIENENVQKARKYFWLYYFAYKSKYDSSGGPTEILSIHL